MFGGAVYRCSILMENSPLPLSSLFLIGRVCRKFITYTGQGNLHVFLEIFLALDFTAILALQADGGLAISSHFHKTQRCAQEFETLSASLFYLLVFFLSKLVLEALLVNGDLRLISLHSLWPQEQRSFIKIHIDVGRFNRNRREAGKQSISKMDLCFLLNFSPCSK